MWEVQNLVDKSSALTLNWRRGFSKLCTLNQVYITPWWCIYKSRIAGGGGCCCSSSNTPSRILAKYFPELWFQNPGLQNRGCAVVVPLVAFLFSSFRTKWSTIAGFVAPRSSSSSDTFETPLEDCLLIVFTGSLVYLTLVNRNLRAKNRLKRNTKARLFFFNLTKPVHKGRRMSLFALQRLGSSQACSKPSWPLLDVAGGRVAVEDDFTFEVNPVQIGRGTSLLTLVRDCTISSMEGRLELEDLTHRAAIAAICFTAAGCCGGLILVSQTAMALPFLINGRA